MLVVLNDMSPYHKLTYLAGYRMGPRLHARYFDLKKFTPERKAEFIKEERGAYTA